MRKYENLVSGLNLKLIIIIALDYTILIIQNDYFSLTDLYQENSCGALKAQEEMQSVY